MLSTICYHKLVLATMLSTAPTQGYIPIVVCEPCLGFHVELPDAVSKLKHDASTDEITLPWQPGTNHKPNLTADLDAT